MTIEQWVKDLTEECFGGPPFSVGDQVKHPDGRLVQIVGGQFWGERGLSNFWYWKEVLGDGKLGPEECGYGWKLGPQRVSDAQLAKEAADWDSGKLSPKDKTWVDAPEAVPYTAADIKVLSDDPSPCMFCGRPKVTSKTPFNAKGVCWRTPGMGKDNTSVLDCQAYLEKNSQ